MLNKCRLLKSQLYAAEQDKKDVKSMVTKGIPRTNVGKLRGFLKRELFKLVRFRIKSFKRAKEV